MAIKKTQRGFSLLIAIIFMSVMLSFGLTLGALGYKQSTLAGDAVRSQDAFYVADAALECLLYADQQQGLFVYPATLPGSPPAFTCAGSAPTLSSIASYTASRWAVSARFPFDNGAHCADVMVSEPAVAGQTTYIYAQGYDVPCATIAAPGSARFASRGIAAHYAGAGATAGGGGGGGGTNTQSFAYTGANQSFTVPAGVTSLTVKAWGAGGASNNARVGGAGGYSSGTIAVTAGQTYTIVVGGGGSMASGASGGAGGFGGGASGGNDESDSHAGGGGGYSGIFLGIVAQGNAKLVAGGGGGGSGRAAGGAGGGASGNAGSIGCSGSPAAGGGTQSSGGASPGVNGAAAGSALGGGGGGSYLTNYIYAGGGGGGGYFGGAGAAANDVVWCEGGGGGGSGYAPGGSTTSGTSATPPNIADADYVAGVGIGGSSANGGNGLVVVSW